MTEAEKTATEGAKSLTEVELNDNRIRLFGIPFFGIIIPHISGLFGSMSPADYRFWIGHVFFIGLAAVIWQGNRYLLFRTRKRFTWFDKPIEKLILLLVNNIFFTAPVTIAWLCSWYALAGFAKTDWSSIQITVLVNVICVLFVTNVYETVFLFKEKESESLKNAKLLKAKAEAELAALKNQVDPHFMFNSLNTLSHLIPTDHKKALRFTENLADVYRYILSQKDQALVMLEDELEFTGKYTELLHLRFGNALTIKRNFNGSALRDFVIPPTSIFIAFENVVKHNEISEQHPLKVDMSIEGNNLVITNMVRAKRNRPPASGLGLRNLDERFRIVTGKGISSGASGSQFVITFPLMPVNS